MSLDTLRSICCNGLVDTATNGHLYVCMKCGNRCNLIGEKCGYMILTPTPEHNGGMWCAELLPCKFHTKGEDGLSDVARSLKISNEKMRDLERSAREMPPRCGHCGEKMVNKDSSYSWYCPAHPKLCFHIG